MLTANRQDSKTVNVTSTSGAMSFFKAEPRNLQNTTVDAAIQNAISALRQALLFQIGQTATLSGVFMADDLRRFNELTTNIVTEKDVPVLSTCLTDIEKRIKNVRVRRGDSLTLAEKDLIGDILKYIYTVLTPAPSRARSISDTPAIVRASVQA